LTSACSSAASRSAKPVLVQRVDHIDVAGREPMVVEHPNGTLFVAGYGEPRPTLWKSTDRGATWSRVNVGTEADGAIGNSDVDLGVARDGTLYFASMLFDRKVREGRQIAIGVSTDAGATWRWTTVTKHRFDDRPWVDVAPDGTAHAIWNDGSGVNHVLSTDRGTTWSTPARIHDKGGSSHLAIGPGGEVAVRITPASASGNKFDEGVDLIAVSADRGASWSKQPAPGARDWSADPEASAGTPRWVEPVAWDVDGRLYSLWTDKSGVWVARSADRGATWQSWRIVQSSAKTFYPYLIAVGRGELAATWFSTTGADWKDLQWHLARISVPGDYAQPRVTESPAQTLESARPRHGQGEAIFNDTGGEYLAIAALRDGSIGVVSPIQNRAAQRMGFTWWRFE
jgi:hypothetical protein